MSVSAISRPGQQHRQTPRGNELGGHATERVHGWNGWDEARGKPLPFLLAHHSRSLVFRALPTEFSNLPIVQWRYSSRPVLPLPLPPSVSATCYGLSAFIFADTLEAYLKFYFLQGGSPVSNTLRDFLVEWLTLGSGCLCQWSREICPWDLHECGPEESSGVLRTSG